MCETQPRKTRQISLIKKKVCLTTWQQYIDIIIMDLWMYNKKNEC